MSLSKFINQENIKEIIRPHIKLLPKIAYKPLLVPSIGLYAFEGTAFDYCLRFLIYKKFKEQVDRKVAFCWIASIALKMLPLEQQNFWIPYVSRGKQLFEDFSLDRNVSIEQIAICSQYLANLDNAKRCYNNYNPNFKHNDKLTEELMNLMDIPDNVLEQFSSNNIYLNPFMRSGKLVKGADADIITDNCIYEIKTVKRLEITEDYIHQLLGYYVLNRMDGLYEVKTKSVIDSIGVYFSRHKKLYKYDIDDIVNNIDDLYSKLKKEIKDYSNGYISSYAFK